ncbi:MAG TPA: dentilisin complex serine proteinase subunit PrtP [Spirochaetales bacterium]|nr:dentilisin complex serine proteinase subunit PrtP [Spirochaetales bacterium]
MKKYLFFVLIVLTLMTACTNSLDRTNPVSQVPTLNKINPLASDAELMANEWVNYGYIIAKTDASTNPEVFKRLGLAVKGKLELDNGAVYYRLYRENKIAKALHDLRGLTGVEYAQAELKSKLIEPVKGFQNQSDVQYRGLTGGNLEDDPKSAMNDYALAITKALDSYKPVSEGGNGYGTNTVYVAVIDTGINMTHEDFYDDQNNLIVEYAKSAFTKNPDNTFTWVGDGKNFVTIPQGENWDDEAHGTHVSGTIAAVGDNGKGVAGVAWKNVKLISYKCFANADSGSGADWSIYGALGDLADWVKANRASKMNGQVTVPVNMSLGGSYAGSFELEMINYAIENGVLPIVAMGNDGQRVTKFPAAYQGVVAVGATNGRDEKVHFSNTGHWISVSAPGYDILSCGNGGDYWDDPNLSATDYQWMSGTSMATPFVTGVVAYMLSFNNTLTPYQVKQVLELTADDKGTSGFDESFGHGRVNVLAAATKVRTGIDLPPSGSYYVTKKLVVTVNNNSNNYHSGLGDPYDKVLIDQKVYLYDANGKIVSIAMTNGTNGQAAFYGLPAGNYTIKTSFFGDLQTRTVSVDNSADQNISIDYNKNIIYVCTVKNNAYNGGADTTDTIIEVYSDDELTTLVGSIDQGYLDTLAIELSAGTYYAKISPYNSKYGNYGIQIGFTRITEVNLQDGSRTAIEDDSHEEDDDGALATAKGALTLDTPFAANLQDTADVFMFVVP